MWDMFLNLEETRSLLGNWMLLVYNLIFGVGAWKVTQGDLVISNWWKYGTLYVIEFHIEVGSTLGVIHIGIELSHKRIEHMSKEGLEILDKKDQLPCLKSLDMDLYEHCIYYK